MQKKISRPFFSLHDKYADQVWSELSGVACPPFFSLPLMFHGGLHSLIRTRRISFHTFPCKFLGWKSMLGVKRLCKKSFGSIHTYAHLYDISLNVSQTFICMSLSRFSYTNAIICHLSAIELNFIVRANRCEPEKCARIPGKIPPGAATTNSASFSPPLKQLKDLSCSLGIYVLMAQ